MIVTRLQRGAEESEDAIGVSATIQYLVEDVAGDAATRLRRARRAPGIPRVGQPYGAVPGIQVLSVRCAPEAEDSENYLVTVDYGRPDSETAATGASGVSQAEVSIDATTISETVFRDVKGRYLRVRYAGRPKLFDADTGNPVSSTFFVKQTTVEQVTVQRPSVSVRISRLEAVLPRQAPFRATGKVNSSVWSGFAPKTWLCTGITSAPEPGGRYRVDYAFVYAPDTWRAEVTALYQGFIPSDAVEGNGIEVYDVYEDIDFNQLGVSF